MHNARLIVANTTGILTTSSHEWKHLIPTIPQPVNLLIKQWLEKPNKISAILSEETSRGLREEENEAKGNAIHLPSPQFHLLSWYTIPFSSSLFLACSIPTLCSCPLLFSNFIRTKNVQKEWLICRQKQRTWGESVRRRMPKVIYQELWGAEYIQSERLDPGVVDSQLPVDPRTFNTGEDAQVGGQPRWVWEAEKARNCQKKWREEQGKQHMREKREKWIWLTRCPWAKRTKAESNFCSTWANFDVSLWKAVGSGNVIVPWRAFCYHMAHNVRGKWPSQTVTGLDRLCMSGYGCLSYAVC